MKLLCKHTNYPLKFVRNIYGDEVYFWNARSIWKCPECGKRIFKNYTFNQGEVSDGYHTFNELYHHRTMMFATICNAHSDISWKSKKHHDPNDEMYDGMFVAGINTPTGQATYHCDIDPYWDLFHVKELEKAPEWDGHDSTQALMRIYSLSAYLPEEMRKEMRRKWETEPCGDE